uniref:SCP domain-containing protein n=1 Tax=Astyanax mexicanus TaxID=7994 RepID=A0A8B9KCZ1_ASTMX
MGKITVEFLQTHNTYRNKHGAPPLTISQDLCRSAKSWADYLLSIKTLQHSSGGKFGENLFYTWSSGGKSLTGHFTQVVWKDTKELGYGVATDGKTVFVVGQYLPPGNFTNPGAFEKNVLPPNKTPAPGKGEYM